MEKAETRASDSARRLLSALRWATEHYKETTWVGAISLWTHGVEGQHRNNKLGNYVTKFRNNNYKKKKKKTLEKDFGQENP